MAGRRHANFLGGSESTSDSRSSRFWPQFELPPREASVCLEGSTASFNPSWFSAPFAGVPRPRSPRPLPRLLRPLGASLLRGLLLLLVAVLRPVLCADFAFAVFALLFEESVDKELEALDDLEVELEALLDPESPEDGSLVLGELPDSDEDTKTSDGPSGSTRATR